MAATDWLALRLHHLVERIPADRADLSRPEARVAMRALEVRSRNLQGAASAAAAAAATADTDPATAARIEGLQARTAEDARSMLEVLPQVLAHLPPEEARWAAYLGSTLERLLQQQEPMAPRPEAGMAAPDAAHLDAARPDTAPAAAVPDPRGVQKRTTGTNPVPPPGMMAAVLTAARLEQAAERGIPGALYNLAVALLAADGMARDPQRAVGILQGLAHRGYRPAQLRYAQTVLQGDGIPVDEAEALAWFRIAEANGSATAGRSAAALAATLSPAVRAAAERIVAQWMPQAGPGAAPDQEQLDRSLAQAIEDQSFATVERLLHDGADPQALADGGRSALVGAAWRGRRAIVHLLATNGVLLEARDGEQRNALLWAAINGHGDIADDLLDLGADPNARDSDGSTPLIRAAWNGRRDIVARLLTAGADPDLRDASGRTAADRARGNDGRGHGQGDEQILNLLGPRGPR